MNATLEQLDLTRHQASRDLMPETKSELGQFLTPSRIAEFMASLLDVENISDIRLLDAGAGIGSLSIAFFEQLINRKNIQRINWVGYEIDETLNDYLENYIQQYEDKFTAKYVKFNRDIRKVDFIEDSVKRLLFRTATMFNFAIINPPYKKIHSHSRHRLLLRELKIETVNLYTAFVALTIDLMADGGQIVAIIPRSFCNGPYYKSFRERLLKKTAIRHIHLFASRDKAFRDEQVLQENIIILLERNGKQENVIVSTSTDADFLDYKEAIYPFNYIVSSNDLEKFIHIPISCNPNPLDTSTLFRFSLKDLGIEVSTGPIIDFRIKEHLRLMPDINTVPLLYPVHFSNSGIEWPKVNSRKSNALVLNDETEHWLYPNGFYCVVRRFSSKEEIRRIVASVVQPAKFGINRFLGFENHLNVFHEKKQGLPENLARGLTVYLNTTAVDDHFRRFSGHTQINATDLRQMRYPSRKNLIALGEWAKLNDSELTQTMLDEQLERLTT